jgi:hypothetical protein
MNTNFGILLAFSLIGLTNGCKSQELNCSLETKYGKFKFSESDSNTVRDLLVTCDKEIPSISKELNIDIDNSIIIEIYSSQDNYNSSIMNPALKDSPAISGDFKIQMVSPLSPLEAENKVGKIKYHDRMYFLVHEYVHLLIDKLESQPPLCIDEGIACFYSSKDFYLDMASKYVKQINYIPSVEQLVTSYDKVPAPDLFSFLLVGFIVQTKGRETLPDLIRQPDYIMQMDDIWVEFVKKKYY